MHPGNLDYKPFQGQNRADLMAFTGMPRKVLLSPGEMLCRFITAENEKVGHRGNEVFGSPVVAHHGFLHEDLQHGQKGEGPAPAGRSGTAGDY